MNFTSVWTYRLYRGLWNGLDRLFPPVCGGCGIRGTRWCPECQNNPVPVPEPIGEICVLPQPTSEMWASCLKSRPPFRALRSWHVFKGSVRGAFHHLKYRRNLGMGDVFAVQLAKFALRQKWDVDIVTPTILSKTCFAERGYNQVEVITYPFSLASGLSYSQTITRNTRHTRSRVGFRPRSGKYL